RARLAALQGLALTAPEAKDVRSLCVEAHELLLGVEETQATLKGHLDEVEGDETRLTEERRSKLESSLAEANTALAKARELLPRCQTRVGELARVHRIRR